MMNNKLKRRWWTSEEEQMKNEQNMKSLQQQKRHGINYGNDNRREKKTNKRLMCALHFSDIKCLNVINLKKQIVNQCNIEKRIDVRISR